MAEPSAALARMLPRQLGFSGPKLERELLKAFSPSLPPSLARSLSLSLCIQHRAEKMFVSACMYIHMYCLRFCVGTVGRVTEAWAAFTGSLDVQGGSGDLSLFCGRLVGQRGCAGESWLKKASDGFRSFSECAAPLFLARAASCGHRRRSRR